jgi:hypothetical protein
MKHIAILPLTLLFLSAGAVQSQAPVTDSIVSQLETMETSNKAIIDQQQKTLDVLDKLDQDADQVKTLTKRG